MSSEQHLQSGEDPEITLNAPGTPQTPPAAEKEEDDFEITLAPPPATAAVPAESGEKTADPAGEPLPEIKEKTDIEIKLEKPVSPLPPEEEVKVEEKPQKKKKEHSSRPGCFFFLLFLAALAGGAYYVYRNYWQETRSLMVYLELKMSFRLFKKDVEKLSRDEINFGDAMGRTEVHKTAADGELPRMEKLLASGGDVNALDTEKNTVFHYAAKSGNTEMMALLRKNARKELFTAANNDGELPLHIAAKYNLLPMVKYLLKYGADPDKLTNSKKSAFDLASSPEVREVLKKASALNNGKKL